MTKKDKEVREQYLASLPDERRKVAERIFNCFDEAYRERRREEREFSRKYRMEKGNFSQKEGDY